MGKLLDLAERDEFVVKCKECRELGWHEVLRIDSQDKAEIMCEACGHRSRRNRITRL